MTQRTIRDQQGLDQAIADGVDRIIINSPEGVWIEIGGDTRVAEVKGSSCVRVDGSASVGRVTGSARVDWVTGSASVGRVTGSARVDWVTGSASVGRVDGSARVDWVTGSARVDWVTGSASVGRVDGSARVGRVDGSARVGRVDGSARVDWVDGSARVGRVDGSARVDWVTGSARVDWVDGSASVDRVDGSASVDWVTGSASVRSASQTAAVHLHGGTLAKASPIVAVFVHTADSTWSGGTLIDLRDLDLQDPVVWCEYHGVEVADGVATLYKAVNNQWTTGYGVDYSPGALPVAPDWRDDHSCGGGLHFSPSPQEARSYQSSATRFVAVGVEVATLRPILDSTPKAKAPRVVRACVEVDIHGEPVLAEVVAAR